MACRICMDTGKAIATTIEMCQYYSGLSLFAGPKETEKVYGCTTKLVYLPSLIDKS